MHAESIILSAPPAESMIPLSVPPAESMILSAPPSESMILSAGGAKQQSTKSCSIKCGDDGDNSGGGNGLNVDSGNDNCGDNSNGNVDIDGDSSNDGRAESIMQSAGGTESITLSAPLRESSSQCCLCNHNPLQKA